MILLSVAEMVQKVKSDSKMQQADVIEKNAAGEEYLKVCLPWNVLIVGGWAESGRSAYATS